MTTYTRRLAQPVEAADLLCLTYAEREKTRLRARLASGGEAALLLPRGGALRDGDCVASDDGQVARIVAAAEPVLEVLCHDAAAFARCAYHLGNRHTPLEIVGLIDDGHWVLRIREDHVLEEMLEGLGAHCARTTAAFEPESGAYGGGHHHHAHDDHDDHDHGHAPHPGSRMPVHEPKIHRPDPAAWRGTQDK